MTALPIIERELRTQARLAFTYGLRVLGAAALLLVWLYYGFNPDFPPSLGGRLFGSLNCTLFISIWIAVPLLSADCISRERREGTLGLLFLTPLKAREIILAKGLVHGVRAVTLWLATLPVLVIPFVLGGVTWRDAVLSALTNFSALCWALAAGLLASSMAKAWVRAQLFACLFGICFGVAFIYVTGFNLLLSIRTPLRSGANLHDQVLMAGIFGATGIGGWWARILGSLTTSRQWSLLLGEGRMALLSILVLLAAVGVAARNLRRAWQETPPSARQLWVEEKFCTPILWVSFFHRWMRRKLERNPIGWLEQRTWSGRLVMWGWFAMMISLYSAALNGNNVTRLLNDLQTFMAWLLIGVMAVSAAGSFQRERETGVLELLLVSPLSEEQIIGGRLRGLWGQFFPALVVLLGVWIYLAGVFPDPYRNLGMIQFYCSAYLTLPVIGLYCSLRRRNFISAFLFTVFLGLVIPFGLKMAVNWFAGDFLGISSYGLRNGYRDFEAGGRFMFTIDFTSPIIRELVNLTYSAAFLTLVQAIVAFCAGRQLYRDLARRNFAFSKPVN